jgi:hypothetical protein
MSPSTLRLIACLLVPIQIWIGAMRGHELCVEIRDDATVCGTVHDDDPDHRHGEHAACDHDHDWGDRSVHAASHDEHGDCGCHIHVRASTDDDPLSQRAVIDLGSALDARNFPATDTPPPSWRWRTVALRPPDERTPAHLGPLSTTRLLI